MLKFHIANFSALLAKYTHNLFSKMSAFIENLPDDRKELQKANISEGALTARTALQASLDSADIAAQTIAISVVMCWASWFHLSRFLKKVQATVEDLLFEGQKLFAENTNVSLHTLNDSWVTLKTLDIYVPANKKKQGRFYDQRFWAAPYSQPQRQYDQQCKRRQDASKTERSLLCLNHPPPDKHFLKMWSRARDLHTL
ncbi:hypothetical protein UY3_03846 [Chelonia mydas]|uniref:Uncharacterized protein n=1 Tax=Chelonia mydas TaxID=8469 RepID=M7C3D9_CHEMY|nr:hypothetical protein UY3_03846 [Chelonia mydas]